MTLPVSSLTVVQFLLSDYYMRINEGNRTIEYNEKIAIYTFFRDQWTWYG